MVRWMDMGGGHATQEKPRRVEADTHEHRENSAFLQHWSDELNEVLWRQQDCLEDDQYEERLMRHGLWTTTVQRDRSSGLIFCVIAAHTLGFRRVTWALEAATPYQELIHKSAQTLKSMANHNRDRNAL